LRRLTTSDLDADHGFFVERYAAVTSTQDVLRSRLMNGGDVTFAAVRALEQSAGRGRRGGVWRSSPGGSYQSVGLPPTSAAPLLPLALGVGVAEALSAAGAATSVKWPNDLVLGGRKLGGIVVEVVQGVPIVGLGVNVANEVPAGATALRGWEVETVGDVVLVGVGRGLELLRRGASAVSEHFSSVDWLLGKRVELAGAPFVGTGAGIDPDGSLRLLSPSGQVTAFGGGHVVSVDGEVWGTQ